MDELVGIIAKPLYLLLWPFAMVGFRFGPIGLILLVIGLVFGIWALVKLARKMEK